jgi:ribonuclease E
MARKMLIDATHAEEVRVAIVDGDRLDEFDSETSTKRQLKGNIYLAKVIRIEPSLQAAFVDFGGNRHGFLPFGEIHPDYYHIPMSDRQKEIVTELHDVVDVESDREEVDVPVSVEEEFISEETEQIPSGITQETAVDFVEDLPSPEYKSIKAEKPYRYKIQEVIKRRQIMLVQVVKEERGNKGAALTTFLSLPGRYCVLMPNAGHRGGGISRKISDGQDRRRLKDVLKELNLPEGMSLIVRTAGQERNKLEIRRDFDYLLRLWEEIRQKTLESIAPTLVYAEGDLIKRAIRDIYDRDIEQIFVEGEEGYKAAKKFMKALIPSHAKRVQPYRHPTISLFRNYRVDEQIDAIMNPVAMLPSGGSIVINPTEALVAIDVNSGRSIKERHIDETALKTNLEAADEIARQVRLRDLGGLIVIDFIDMSDSKNIQAVEKRLKEATKNDRARIQMGRISQFGLLELSRQRLRPSILEINSMPCSHCRGTGVVRSIESMALHVLRAIENEGIQGKSEQLIVTVPPSVDLYLLNQKRASLLQIERRYDMSVMVTRDDSLVTPDFRVETLTFRTPRQIVQESKPIAEETPKVIPVKKAASETKDEGEEKEIREEIPQEKIKGRRQHYTQRRDRRAVAGNRPKTIEEQIIEDIFSGILPPEELASSEPLPSDSFLPVEEGTGEETSEPPQQRSSRHDYRRRRGRRGNGLRQQKQLASEEEGSRSDTSTEGQSLQTEEPTEKKQKSTKIHQEIKVGEKTKEDLPQPQDETLEIEAPVSPKKGRRGWWKRLLESD